MRHLFESGTDVACHALFDPAATAGAAAEELGEALAEGGRLLSLYTASDGSLALQLLVDEALPDAWRARAKTVVERLLLRVPSGTLVLAGLEYVDNAEEVAKASSYAHARSASLTSGRVLPGAYEADVLLLDWDDAREIAPEMKRKLGVQYSVEQVLGPLTGVAFFVGLVGTIAALIGAAGSAVKGAWPPAWYVAAPLLLAAGFLAAKWLERPEWCGRRRAAESEFPEVLVLLRRLPDDTDLASRRGGVARLAEAVDTEKK
jgi:hypothetical protein